jgi:hypothetical protein
MTKKNDWKGGGAKTAIAFGIAAGFVQTAVAAPGDLIGDPIAVGTAGRDAYYYAGPRVASDANGNFVATWVNTGGAVVARRYAKDGTPLADAFQVAPAPSSEAWLRNPTVAVNAKGQFVVAWSVELNGNQWCVLGPTLCYGTSPVSVHAQTFNVDGTSISGDVVVANKKGGNPEVAIDDDGDFAVNWTTGSRGLTFSFYAPMAYNVYSAVYVRAYSVSGKPKTATIKVDSGTEMARFGSGREDGRRDFGSSVAMDGNGNFTVVWSKEDVSTASRGVYTVSYAISGHSYSVTGTPLDNGDAFQINTSVAGLGYQDAIAAPSIAMNRSGQFVVAWQGCNGVSICARSYDPGNKAITAEIDVAADLGTYSPTLLEAPRSAIDASGNFIVSVIEGLDESVRLFAHDGTSLSASMLLQQTGPTADAANGVAMDATGDAVVAYFGPEIGGDGGDSPVLVQRVAGP